MKYYHKEVDIESFTWNNFQPLKENVLVLIFALKITNVLNQCRTNNALLKIPGSFKIVGSNGMILLLLQNFINNIKKYSCKDVDIGANVKLELKESQTAVFFNFCKIKIVLTFHLSLFLKNLLIGDSNCAWFQIVKIDLLFTLVRQR